MKEISFSLWLVQAFEIANKRPSIWLGYVLFMAVCFGLGRISLGLNIVISMTSLFVGIGVVQYIDQRKGNLTLAVKQHLPMAVLWATLLMLIWFVFRVIANIYSGEEDKILLFFYNNELAFISFEDKNLRQTLIWLYSSSITCLVFVLLMLNSFASWFSYLLMHDKKLGWDEAKQQGKHGFSANTKAMYPLMTFVLFTAIIGIALIPLLTPLFYMLVSTLMYVSYQDIFVKK